MRIEDSPEANFDPLASTIDMPVVKTLCPGVFATGEPQIGPCTVLFTDEAANLREKGKLLAIKQSLAPFLEKSEHQITVDCTQVTGSMAMFVHLLASFSKESKKPRLLLGQNEVLREVLTTTGIIKIFEIVE